MRFARFFKRGFRRFLSRVLHGFWDKFCIGFSALEWAFFHIQSEFCNTCCIGLDLSIVWVFMRVCMVLKKKVLHEFLSDYFMDFELIIADLDMVQQMWILSRISLNSVWSSFRIEFTLCHIVMLIIWLTISYLKITHLSLPIFVLFWSCYR